MSHYNVAFIKKKIREIVHISSFHNTIYFRSYKRLLNHNLIFLIVIWSGCLMNKCHISLNFLDNISTENMQSSIELEFQSDKMNNEID